MEFNAVIKKRKSVRSFESKKPDWRNILEAIDVANQGPFAGNHNHLKFMIIEKKSTIKEIAKICEQEWISEAGILIIVCSDDSHLEEIYGERGRVYSKQQAGAAVQSIIFKLTELDVASCWVGSYSDPEIKKELDIPVHMQIEAIIPTGYEKGSSPKKTKKDLETTIYWERWLQNRRPNALEEKKENFFYKEEKV